MEIVLTDTGFAGFMPFSKLAGEKPVELLVDLVKRSRPKTRLSDSPSITDLYELLALKEVREQCIIWLDSAKRAAAFAYLDPYNNLVFECPVSSLFHRYFDEAVNFCDKAMREKYKDEAVMPTLDASCRADDLERLAALERNGFKKEELESLSFLRGLDEEIPAPILPDGFRIRPLKGRSELADYIALHQAAFGTGQMNLEMREAIMASPDYDPALDLVAEAPVGRLAGLCVCQIFKEENRLTGERVGWTDPLGVHPDLQGKGLAKALMLSGFALLKSRGMRTARVDTSSENIKMIALAKSLGSKESGRRLWFAQAVKTQPYKYNEIIK